MSLFPWVPDWSPDWKRSARPLIPMRHCVEWEIFKEDGSVRTDKERQEVFDAWVVRMLMAGSTGWSVRNERRTSLVALGWVYRAVHPAQITSCHEFLIASKHLESWVFMQPEGGSVDWSVDSWVQEALWVQGRIAPVDRLNVSLLVNLMSTEISRLPSGRRLSNLMVTFSLPPDFPRQHLVHPQVQERVSKYLEACLAVVKADFHESLMLLKALSALRDESKDFAKQYTLAEGRSILAESAIRMSFRDMLAWNLWVGPIRMSVSAPSTHRVDY